MSNQANNPNDDSPFSRFLNESSPTGERRRFARPLLDEDTERPAEEQHRAALSSTTLSLDEIRAMLLGGNARNALPHIEALLNTCEKPGEQWDKGRLLKAEICLELKEQAAFVGQVLVELAPTHTESAGYQQLQAGVEQVIRERLESGRNEIAFRVNDALRNFALVMEYATTDPSATLAAALAMLRHLDLKKQAFGPTAKMRAMLDRCLEVTIERSQAGTIVYDEANRHRVMLWLHEGKLDESMTWLYTHATHNPYYESLVADARQRAMIRAEEGLMALLRTGQFEKAESILHLAIQGAPNVGLLHIIQAELAWLKRDSQTAFAAFAEAERVALDPIQFADDDATRAAWVEIRQITIACVQCGKSNPPALRNCAYCNQALGRLDLILDTYYIHDITPAGVQLMAQVGQVHLLAQTDPSATLPKIQDLLTQDLPKDAHAKLKALADELNLRLHPTETPVIIAKKPASRPTANFLRRLAPEEDDEEPAGELAVIKPPPPPPNFEPEIKTMLAERYLSGEMLARLLEIFAKQDEHLSLIPIKTRLTVGKRLLGEGHLEIARDLLPQLFADNPARKSVKTLYTMLDWAIYLAIDALLEEAQENINRGLVESALELCETALHLRPDDPAARLVRGVARRQLGADLAALDDFYRVMENAPERNLQREARVLAAETLEARWDVQAALDLLDDLADDTDLDPMRYRLHRRLDGMPVIHLENATCVVMTDTLARIPAPPYTHAYFAISVRAVGRGQSSGWAEKVLTGGFEFIQVLGGLRNSVGDPVFALRFVCDPHPRIPEQGKITISLIARMSGDDACSAERQAINLWMALKDILPLQRDYAYLFEPVVDENELKALLQPFEISNVAEIVRREDLPSATNDRYAVYPFTPAMTIDLHNVLWALLRQPAPAMVSLHLLPTTMMAWERSALDKQMAEQKSGSDLYTPENVQQVDRVAAWWQESPRWGQAQANRYLLDALSLHAYILQVNLAGSDGISSLFPELAAAALFGPPRMSGDVRYGGYEIVRATNPAEMCAARENLTRLDVERWVDSCAPESAPRLRYLVSETEAALAFRLPIPGPDGLPAMPVIEAKPVPPPSSLPSRGTLLGESVARVGGAPMPIIQSTDDRRRHIYIVGKTGTGKSTLIKGMALQDIAAGHGVCVVDPHGDLIDDILLRIPEHRADDVIVFDPSDEARPIGLNLLDHQKESERHQVVNEFIGLLMRMYDPGGTNMIVGPRFQHNVRMAMLTAMSVPGSTLIEVVRALTDSAYVKSIMPHVTDPMVRLYWEKQIAQTSDYHKSEILDYIVSKFSRFTGDQRVRNIIGQSDSTVNFRQVMDRRQVLLVNLSKGKIGPENAQFLGLLMVQQLLLTALSRADLPASERPDFYLYVDEFQNFATEMFGTMLSEGRKYGVALTVANQYLTQLPHPIREAIFGNVGSMVSFRLGTQDALALAPELYPVFNADDLLNLPRYTASVKLLVDGLAARPFTMRTVPDLRPPNSTRAEHIRNASRTRYGRDAAVVTEEVLSRLKARG